MDVSAVDTTARAGKQVNLFSSTLYNRLNVFDMF